MANSLELTSTAADVVDGVDAIKQSGTDPKGKKRNKEFKGRIDICKQYRRKLVPNWTASIEVRKGKPNASGSDDCQFPLNLDWSLTKTKQASLFSQVPQARVSHPPMSAGAGPWLAAFETKLNETILTSGIESTMDECLPDCINAAGLGICLVSYEEMTEDVEVPAIDMASLPPEISMQAMQTGKINGKSIEMTTVPRTMDKRYLIQRISPSDFLWPIDYTGSNFDESPWLGRSGRIPWAEAAAKWKLSEEDKKEVLGDDHTVMDRLNHDMEKDKAQADDKVGFDEIFYKEFQYNPEAKSYSALHHLVFLNGKEDPVVDEPWKGQQFTEDGQLIGSKKYALRVLSLAYISDECIPPSDSAIGRVSVNELNKSREQVIKQRERSLPIRWFDVNRVDPTLQQALMRGTWQNMIPTQGDGTRVIGEVARAVHAAENFRFDDILKNDISEAWTIGPNQLGSGADVETKGESSEIANNFKTREGRERAKVASYFVGIAEVMGGLMCLYEDPTAFGEGFDPSFSTTLGYSILADSTVLLDANQKLDRMNRFLNDYAKSGFVALEPVLREIAILSGLDPNTVVKAPDPKPPVEPNISLRLTGAEDMTNPLLLAFLIESGQAPKPESIEKAKQLIQQAVVFPQPDLGQPPQDPNAPPPPGAPIPPPGAPVDLPPPAPVGVGEANPQATVLPKIGKRSDDPSGDQL